MRARVIVLIAVAMGAATACGTLLDIQADPGTSGAEAGAEAAADGAAEVDGMTSTDSGVDAKRPPVCALADAACGSTACCSNAGACRNGICACGTERDTCQKESECCAPLGCAGGGCCVKSGAQCSLANNCCGGGGSCPITDLEQGLGICP